MEQKMENFRVKAPVLEIGGRMSNGRVYTKEHIEKLINDWNNNTSDHAKVVTCEEVNGFPCDNPFNFAITGFANIVGKVNKLSIDNGYVVADMTLIPVERGKMIKDLLDRGDKVYATCMTFGDGTESDYITSINIVKDIYCDDDEKERRMLHIIEK